jgi:hypothetical protein
VRQQALSGLLEDVFAASNKHVMEAKWRTICRALSFWSEEPLPPNEGKIRHLAAALKHSGYRSAATYLSLYKTMAARDGYPLDETCRRVLLDSVRSCERGVGAPAKALALPFERIGSLKCHREPLTVVGPLCLRNLVVAGSWYLCREIEISLALATSISLEDSSGKVRAHWRLPVSKTEGGGQEPDDEP